MSGMSSMYSTLLYIYIYIYTSGSVESNKPKLRTNPKFEQI